MQRDILKLEVVAERSATAFRTIIKTKHGRVIFLAIEIQGSECEITNCFYVDRNQGQAGEKRCRSKPLKLKTFNFPVSELLSVIETELDKKFYDVEYVKNESFGLSLNEYLLAKEDHSKYHFLIMVGEGEVHNGLPAVLRTRLKNKFHRAVYLELAYYKNGKGVVRECYYYDITYLRKGVKITPPTLTSCFFPYSQDGILNLLNNEICCCFTHILVTNGIDLDSNTTPLCGSI